MEKKRMIYPIVTGLIVIGFFSCIIAFAIEVITMGNSAFQTNYNYVTTTRDVKDFNKVVLDGYGNLEITQGDTESLTIIADEEQMKSIQTDVTNNTLTLNTDKNYNQKLTVHLFVLTQNPSVRFILTVKDLNDINIKGAGNVTISKLSTNKFNLDIEGAGNLNADNLYVKDLEITIKGAGNATLVGNADKMSLKIKGAGNFDGESFIVKDVTTETDGAGNATVNATNTLDASIKGVGNVNYLGNPKVTKSISGLGSISRD